MPNPILLLNKDARYIIYDKMSPSELSNLLRTEHAMRHDILAYVKFLLKSKRLVMNRSIRITSKSGNNKPSDVKTVQQPLKPTLDPVKVLKYWGTGYAIRK